ncbi:uncharacterized protein LOC120084908 [Benincasa hispida]|uniref:uncharacterized protein LOC120084908 n=1 Tax=Benincasa hispida TaxID=102211 RepID=UPI0018FF8A83|nr:uncharacterized protein LOC120084908 [Benincasa hispida]
MKDPGSFSLPYSIDGMDVRHALCDLGASINLMPLLIFKKLGIGEAKPTTITLQLADRSITYPEGKIEDVFVKVDEFIFFTDFIILNYEADIEIPIILGRPFLSIGRALIDMQKGELTIRVDDQQVKFNVFNALKFINELETCQHIEDLGVSFWEAMNEKLREEKEKELAIEEAIHVVTMSNPIFDSLNLEEREAAKIKPSLEEPPLIELKALPSHLMYVYLGDNDILPIIISSALSADDEVALLQVLRNTLRPSDGL